MKKKKRKLKKGGILKLLFLITLLPALLVSLTLSIIVYYFFNPDTVMTALKETPNLFREMEVPEEYIPLYKETAEEYGIPWTLLAAHHRVETRFSTMDPLLSPVGAEGHMQFMPCTFVGWGHPTCSGLGEGDIPEDEKTDPVIIEAFGGYGIDGNDDGVADPYDLTDALYSAANYLAKNGAADGDLEKAIFQYNHSDEYVEDVLHYYNLYNEEFAE
ncbi:lytic transglycosylase domain-containing protein [Planomicrobium okeanokoites]|uniref:Lytic transglycosylase domain-containing protein n=1 Tax=Planomicrobium okeanokoites TaxID=244 RepID=A0ABV7KQZ5_PLAOK|nr:lytic transglycosylase domain-containing protein [Planomicrobium okeanokoites]TAA71065.1 lytic transglycosylase domain-containing protein [Planomicrobium okeanokoites]